MPFTIEITFSDEQMAELVDRLADKIGGVSRNPLTVAEFANEIGRDESYVRRQIYAGVIVKADMPGQTKILYSELERYRNGGKPARSPE